MADNNLEQKGINLIKSWQADWCKFAREALGVMLDQEQEAILQSVQFNPRTSVASGTARGKDFVTAVAAICFMYLTPRWNNKGELIENTKVALTGPTDRQVKNIMMPEISRLYRRAQKRGITLPGRLTTYDIRTDSEEWFLTGFKADEHNHEAWSGFHAVNTMFGITEASGISDSTYDAIEGNLQGNSRILLVFNPNTTIGYAAKSQKGARWNKFRLNSLTAPNVQEKRIIIPGQVDYPWVKDKLELWCDKIRPEEAKEEEADFKFEEQWYRPTDVFRVKVLGRFPKVDEGVLIPEEWIELAQKRWHEYAHPNSPIEPLRLGVDVAGMGRDCTVYCHRFGDYVKKFDVNNSGGVANHMEVAGKTKILLDTHKDSFASIDTIGEGAGVYSRLVELGYKDTAISCKYSESAKGHNEEPLKDINGVYEFANMRAYLFWAARDWLNPANKRNAMLPPGDNLKEEASEIKWKFRSDGKIIIEDKEDIKKRLGRSPDEFDALANTFYPYRAKRKSGNAAKYFGR